ncbi:hypothetical protein C8T65DRAFT_664488 [Cerioporus squamosus]|nr:hypothetical protein C8T65DRAFT_664488 [Cerioporus squamosus]
MSDNAASPDGIALAALPAARVRSNLPRTAEATPPSPASPEPRTPPTHAGNVAQPQPRPQPTTARGRAWRKVLELLGYAGQSRSAQWERRVLVRYLTVVVLSLSQILVIIVLTAVAGVRKSPLPERPGQTELSACTILAAWNLIWLGRLVLKLYLESWLYLKSKRALRREARRRTRSRELPAALASGHGPPDESAQRMPSHRTLSCHVLLLKLDPFLAIVWFFSAILVIYAHGSRCRVAAQTISAATYTILIVVYAHFVLTTIIPMILMMRARRQVGRPTIDKLSRAQVDRIPLVVYIPPPPGDAPTSPTSPITPLPLALSNPALSSHPAPATPTKRRRFVFFRPALKRRKTDNTDLERGADDLPVSPAPDADEWDQMFGPAPYPFVRLPENRATCGICLAEFEAPRRLNGRDRDKDRDDHPTENPDGDEAHELAAVPRLEQGSGGAQITEVRVESPRPVDAGALQLADSDNGDAPEPLRLLSCGHVYHKDCVDQWLTQRSGRCPYCQARVEVPPPTSGRRRGWRRGTL